jgi:uncharacterized protein with GYD domain
MPRYFFSAVYTDEGVAGLVKDGGTIRQVEAEKAIASLGGTLESFYYAFGDADVLGIASLPDNVSAAAFSMLITAAGGARVKTTVLLTPEEMDEASTRSLKYRPPGQ